MIYHLLFAIHNFLSIINCLLFTVYLLETEGVLIAEIQNMMSGYEIEPLTASTDYKNREK